MSDRGVDHAVKANSDARICAGHVRGTDRHGQLDGNMFIEQLTFCALKA